MRYQAPATTRELREALYDGHIFLLPPSAASMALVEATKTLLREHLGEDFRLSHTRYDPVDFFHRIGALRRILFTEARFHALTRGVMAAYGFDPELSAFDPPKLRVVTHGGHENPRAQAVYYPHRDTWYGHPQSLVTWWIPLHDLEAEETFHFYPQRFTEEVPNDSGGFDYGRWSQGGLDLRIGWQKLDHGTEAHYPGADSTVDPGEGLGFSCTAAQNLIFSGSHLHGTRPQSLGTSRFSLDFRAVYLPDAESGRGAPNVDNRSTGSALVDYIQPETS